MEFKKRVAIVGAGASGIAAARQALDYDVEPVVFELSNDVGGLWRFKPEETDEGSVMRSTIINTSKELTAYSDFIPPTDYPNYMHNRKLFKYFKMYVQHFKLEPYIRFKHKVENIYRARSYAQTGRWMVLYKDQDNTEKLEEFDGVLLCTGHHTLPYYPPKWPGQEKFKGVIKHAHSYKDGQGYEDKVVAVVGCGNSGIDITVELSRVAEQVYLVTRRGTWVYPRNADESTPLDLIVNRRFYNIFLNITPSWILERMVRQIIDKRLNHEKFGLKPKHGVFEAHLTLNDELTNRLSSGTVVVKPNIRSFTENGVILEDGSSIEKLDEVILSTGYSFVFPLVEEGKLIPVSENEIAFFKNMYPLQTSDHSTLAIIGCIQPLGSIMPISEIQSRLFFAVMTGEAQLPSKAAMLNDVKKKHMERTSRFVKSRRHTIQVDYVGYMDEIAYFLGCRPSILWYLITDPLLGWKLLFGPNAPYAYRLCGPKRWKGARDALMYLQERVDSGMMSRKTLKIDATPGGDGSPSMTRSGLKLMATSAATFALLWVLFSRKVELKNIPIFNR